MLESAKSTDPKAHALCRPLALIGRARWAELVMSDDRGKADIALGRMSFDLSGHTAR